MPKIKWLGIIKGEPADYQKGELAENAVKMKMPSDMNEMMSKSIIFAYSHWLCYRDIAGCTP